MTANPTAPAELDGRRLRGERTREKLLTAAVELFGSRGFEATSMKDLAAAAGVQAPAIYNHFESKESILIAATTWALEDFYRTVVAVDDPTSSAEQRLEQLVRRHVLYQLQHERLARANDLVLSMDALEEVMSVSAHDHIRTLMREYLDLATALVAALAPSSGRDLPPARVTALAILSMCDRVLSWYNPDGALDPKQVAESYWTLVRGMLQLPLIEGSPRARTLRSRRASAKAAR